MSKGIRYLLINTVIVFICLSPIIGKKTTLAANISADSVLAPASYYYKDPTISVRLLSGKNYRNIWSTPVKMKVFDIKTEKGGLTINKLGGGFQTKSLRMKDKNGIEWVLRTVDKDVSGILPGFLRNTFIHRTFQDLISSAYPYAPLTVTDMAKATGVITPQPELFYVPDDPALEPHRAIFANTVCYLERREPTPDYSNAFDTEDMLGEIAKPNIFLDQRAVLRARLLDMLLADWDRHADQWRWGKRDSVGITTIYPMAVDRDQVYFRNTGLLVKIMSISATPHMRGFSEDTDHLRELNYKAHSFDRFFMNSLDATEWKQHITAFHQQLTDEVIQNAIQKLPPEIYNISGAKLINTLKKRREDLVNDAIRYYRFLTTDIYIPLKDEPETIELNENGNMVILTISGTNSKSISYTRTLNPKETKVVHLFQIKENDVLKINSSKIKIKREDVEPIKFL